MPPTSPDTAVRARSVASRAARALLVMVLLVFVAPAVVPGAPLGAAEALAGTYDVHACDNADGTGSFDGWANGQTGGSYLYPSDGCARGQGLALALEPSVPHSSNARVWWGFNAPGNTAIQLVSGNRGASVGPAGPGYQPTYSANHFQSGPFDGEYHGGSEFDTCAASGGCSSVGGRFAYSLNSASAVRFWLICGGSASCPASNPKASASWSDISVRLTDSSNPQASAGGGGLQSDATLHGSENLAFSATDAGGGVRDVQVLVDGAQLSRSTVDDNGGACVAPFHTKVPCKLSLSGEVNVNSAVVADGRHNVAVRVLDAAENIGNVVNRSGVVFDNAPPSVGEVALSGTAQEGQTLTCSATVDGQGLSTAYRWFRSAADGSGEVVIAGASSSSYILTAQDVQRKILCQVTGSDGGGVTSRRSTVTTPPFDNGSVVTPRPGVGAGGNSSQSNPGSTGAGAGSGAGSASSAGPDSKALGGSSNGQGATQQVTLTALFAKNKRTMSTVRYGSAPTIRGKLVNALGQPIADATLDVTATPQMPGATPSAKTGLRTTASGEFTLKLGRGVSSRTVAVAYRPNLDVPAIGGRTVLELRVKAGIRMSVTQTRRSLVFGGRLLGGPFPRPGQLVEVQFKQGRTWSTFSHSVRASKRGRFHLSYALAKVRRDRVYQFRALTRTSASYPYLGSASRGRKFLVR